MKKKPLLINGFLLMFMESIISTKNLSYSIANKQLLNTINIDIKSGVFLGLLGPNGSGKTTLIRFLYGGIKENNDTVFLQERCIRSYSTSQLAKTIAVVFQEYTNEILLTVDEVLKLGRIPHQSIFSVNQRDFTADEEGIIESLDLNHLLNLEFQCLSGGEKQRIMIARALFQKPEILILDEPSNHLDIAHQLSILKYLKSLPITIVCSLHDLNLASQFCDELILLKNGSLIKQGTPETVLDAETIHQVYDVNAYCDAHPKTGFRRVNFY